MSETRGTRENRNEQHKPPSGGRGGLFGNRMPAEKAGDFKGSWKKLISYCRGYTPGIIIALIIATISTVFQFIGPDRLREMTDVITEGLPVLVNGQPVAEAINMSAVVSIAIFLVILYSLSAILGVTGSFILASITAKISKSFRESISKKINKLPLKYFDKTSYGDVISRVTNDVDTIGQTLNGGIDGLLRSFTMIIGTLGMMFFTNVLMTLAALFFLFVGFVVMIVIMMKSQKHFVVQQQGLGDINGHVEEIFSGLAIVKAYNAGKKARKSFEEINDKLYESGWKSQFISGLMMPIMGFIGNFSYVAVCIVGAALALRGNITFGVIVAFIMYVRLLTQPLSQVAQLMQTLQRTAAAGERVFEFLDEDELIDESDKSQRLDNISGDVEFKNVRFGYDADKIIIHDFSAKVRAGQKIAIVGPTGAGKTTMVNLLMRFYELNSGEILIDGVPISRVTRENVHDQFCMVLQDTWLFEGTIKENIIYSKSGVTDDEVTAACKAVGLHHYIRTLPMGYDTVLTDNASLSAGQKQLLTIARAMIQNSPLLILDEATSSVDTRTERHVQDAMDRLTQGRTSFVIAHRLSTIKNADMILVMKDGDIVESGDHITLLAKDGFYAELYNSQFELAS